MTEKDGEDWTKIEYKKDGEEEVEECNYKGDDSTCDAPVEGRQDT